jgi:hypothetical protein
MKTRFNSSDRQLAIGLFAAAILVQFPALFWGFPGSKAIVNALRILNGDVVYRDFWTMYAPGHFYLVAGLIKVFGRHAWVQGLAAQTFIAADAALLFMIVRHVGLPRRVAVLIGASFVGMQWGHREVTSYETALPFLFVALDRIVAYAQGRGARNLVIAGILCGIAAWFKHDVAFHVASGIVVGLTVSWFLVSPRPAEWIAPAGVVGRVVGGAVVAAAPVVALLAWKAGPDAWRDLIVFPATDFRVVRGEPYPPLIPEWSAIDSWIRDPLNVVKAAGSARYLSAWIEANVPQIVFVAGAVAVWLKRRELSASTTALAVLALASMPLFSLSAHVQQNTHLSSLWVCSILFGAVVWSELATRRGLLAVAAGLFVLYTAAFLVRPARQIAEIAYFWPEHAVLEFPNVAGARVARRQYEIYQPIVSFIREHVPESEPIYVGLVRHDAIIISNQTFYYFADRRVASRYNELHPGVADRDDAQREIIADLNRLNVRCIVLWAFGWPKSVMDEELAHRRRYIPEVGATTLDEFIRREYQEVGRYGEYILLWRKGADVPPPPKIMKPQTNAG